MLSCIWLACRLYILSVCVSNPWPFVLVFFFLSKLMQTSCLNRKYTSLHVSEYFIGFLISFSHITKSYLSPESQQSISLLALYVILGVTAGGMLICWCCWAPGWFLWRVSVFRFLPCCNSCCASCQLCGRSCSPNKDHRLAKVTPEGVATPVSSTTTVAV